jgi:hypothetical protein
MGRNAAKPTVAEQRLLQLLFDDLELRRSLLPRLEPEDYDDLPTAPIFNALREIQDEGVDVNFPVLSQKIEADPFLSGLLPKLFMGEEDNESDDQPASRPQVAENCLNALRLMRIDRRISQLSAEIALAERDGNTEQRDQLALEHLDLSRRRGTLLPRT